MKRILRDERGQALVFAALGLVLLVGVAGMAVDMGMLFRSRTNLQKVADAAAIAGASELRSGHYSAAATASATQNGVGCLGCVTVSLGGTYHPTNAVKVVVSQNAPTYFAKVFGYSSVPISATAVAGLNSGGSACIYALNTSPKKDGLAFNGGGSGDGLTMPNCGMYVNSNLNLNGSHQLITAKWVGAVSTSGNGVSSPAVTTPIVPVNDPLASYWPTPVCSSQLNDPKLKSGQATPGCYKALTLSGTATMAAGLYIVQGALSVNIASASGVTFYVDGANGGNINSLSGTLTAPPVGSGLTGTCTSGGGCNGLLLWDTEIADSNHPVTFGSSTLTGVLYLPSAAIKFNGSSATTLNAALVAASYEFDGALTLNSYAVGGGSLSPLASATLVE